MLLPVNCKLTTIDELREALLESYSLNDNDQDFAAKHGGSVGVWRSFFEKYDICSPSAMAKTSTSLRNLAIVERIDEGDPYKDIAEEFDVSIGLISTVAKHDNRLRHRRSSEKDKPARDDAICIARNSGESVTDISSRTGWSKSLINLIVRDEREERMSLDLSLPLAPIQN